MGYAGLWRNRARQPMGQVVFADPGLSARHNMDWDTGAHGVNDDATGRLILAPDARLDYAPETLTDHTEPYITSVRGGPVSQEDSSAQGHGNEYGQFWSENNTQRDIVYPSPVHQVDLGDITANRESRGQIRLQEADLKVTADDYQFQAPGDGSRTDIFVGSFGYPENNPTTPIQQHTPGNDSGRADGPGVSWAGSPHISTRRRHWVERKIPGGHGSWNHDERALYVHTAKSGSDTPAGDSQYVTPFEDTLSSKLRIFSRPVLRRDPAPWDENVLTDGSQQIASSNEFFTDGV